MAAVHPITSVPKSTRAGEFEAACRDDSEPALIAGKERGVWTRYANDRFAIALGGWMALGDQGQNPCLIADSWLRHEETMLRNCYGDYALAVHDKERAVIWLARSPCSSRPLFFRGGNVGDTQIASLAADLAPAVARLNVGSLVEWYAGLVGSSVECMVEGVDRVEPGCVVRIDPTGVRHSRFWDAGEIEVNRSASDRELASGLRSALEAAISDRIPATGPVASLLSAGRDSGCVSSLAARLLHEQGRTLHCLTASPGPDPRFRSTPLLFDEAPGAAAVASQYGNVAHHLITPRGVRFCSEAEALYRHHSAPLGNPLSLYWWAGAQRQAAELGCKTILTGGMGNLTISDGGPIYLADLIAGGKWRHWWRAARNVAAFKDASWLNVLNVSFGGYFPASIYRLAQRLHGRYLPANVAPFLRGELRRRLLSEHGRQDQRPPRSSRERGADLLTAMDVGDVSPELMFGLTMADPTADRRVIEAALRIPPERLVSRYDRRPIFELAFGDLLPKETIRASRRAYQSMDWNLAYDVDDLRDGLSRYRRHPGIVAMLDMAAMEEALNRWPLDRLATLEETAEFGEGLLRAFALAAFLHIHFPD